mgnify:CR=1 FL=1
MGKLVLLVVFVFQYSFQIKSDGISLDSLVLHSDTGYSQGSKQNVYKYISVF